MAEGRQAFAARELNSPPSRDSLKRSSDGSAPRSAAAAPPRELPPAAAAAAAAGGGAAPQGGQEAIRVVVRKRPLGPQAEDIWDVDGGTIRCDRGAGESDFSFARVLGAGCSTQEVYAAAAEGIVSHAVDGWNGTVFAYGQTSSGKTHTMIGDSDCPGVAPLAVQQVFAAIASCDTKQVNFVVEAACFEVYQEEVRDLVTGSAIKVFSTKDGETVLKEPHFAVVQRPEHALAALSKALERRHIASTAKNERSSRSHTIFQLRINRFRDGARSHSVLNLVDLAGSECVGRTKAEGTTATEGKSINRSLFALVRVIDHVAKHGNGPQGGHVPVRDSKLTRILANSIGGDSRTAVICCISGDAAEYENTASTLRFALSATQVRNRPRKAEEAVPAAMRKAVSGLAAAKTEEERTKLREELAKLVRDTDQLQEAREEQKRMKELKKDEVEQAARTTRFLQEQLEAARRSELPAGTLGDRPQRPLPGPQAFTPPPAGSTRAAPPVPPPPLPASQPPPTLPPLSAPAPALRPSEGLRREIEALSAKAREVLSEAQRRRARRDSVHARLSAARRRREEAEGTLAQTCAAGCAEFEAAEELQRKRARLEDEIAAVKEDAENQERECALERNAVCVRGREYEEELERVISPAKKRARLAESALPAARARRAAARAEVEELARFEDPPPWHKWDQGACDALYAEAEERFGLAAARAVRLAEKQALSVGDELAVAERELGRLERAASEERRNAVVVQNGAARPASVGAHNEAWAEAQACAARRKEEHARAAAHKRQCGERLAAAEADLREKREALRAALEAEQLTLAPQVEQSRQAVGAARKRARAQECDCVAGHGRALAAARQAGELRAAEAAAGLSEDRKAHAAAEVALGEEVAALQQSEAAERLSRNQAEQAEGERELARRAAAAEGALAQLGAEAAAASSAAAAELEAAAAAFEGEAAEAAAARVREKEELAREHESRVGELTEQRDSMSAALAAARAEASAAAEAECQRAAAELAAGAAHFQEERAGGEARAEQLEARGGALAADCTLWRSQRLELERAHEADRAAARAREEAARAQGERMTLEVQRVADAAAAARRDHEVRLGVLKDEHEGEQRLLQRKCDKALADESAKAAQKRAEMQRRFASVEGELREQVREGAAARAREAVAAQERRQAREAAARRPAEEREAAVRRVQAGLERAARQSAEQHAAAMAALRGELSAAERLAQESAEREARAKERSDAEMSARFNELEGEVRQAEWDGATRAGTLIAQRFQQWGVELSGAAAVAAGRERALGAALERAAEARRGFAAAERALRQEIEQAPAREAARLAGESAALQAVVDQHQATREQCHAETLSQELALQGWSEEYIDALHDQRKSAALILREERLIAALSRECGKEEEEADRLNQNADTVEGDNRQREANLQLQAERRNRCTMGPPARPTAAPRPRHSVAPPPRHSVAPPGGLQKPRKTVARPAAPAAAAARAPPQPRVSLAARAAGPTPRQPRISLAARAAGVAPRAQRRAPLGADPSAAPPQGEGGWGSPG